MDKEFTVELRVEDFGKEPGPKEFMDNKFCPLAKAIRRTIRKDFKEEDISDAHSIGEGIDIAIINGKRYTHERYDPEDYRQDITRIKELKHPDPVLRVFTFKFEKDVVST